LSSGSQENNQNATVRIAGFLAKILNRDLRTRNREGNHSTTISG